MRGLDGDVKAHVLQVGFGVLHAEAQRDGGGTDAAPLDVVLQSEPACLLEEVPVSTGALGEPRCDISDVAGLAAPPMAGPRLGNQ